MALYIDQDDSSGWTLEGIMNPALHGCKRKRSFFEKFYGWTDQEYLRAKDLTIHEAENEGYDFTKPVSAQPNYYSRRVVLQAALIDCHPDLFRDRHKPNPPAWFVPETVNPWCPRGTYRCTSVIQTWIAFALSLERNLRKRRPACSPKDSPILTSASSSFIPRRADKLRSATPEGMTTARSWDANLHTSPDLTLYIARIAVVEHTMVLSRDRFAFTSWLFQSDGHLDEARLRELVFGSHLDNSSLSFWWFKRNFGSVSDIKVKIWSVRNRLAAETAIKELISSAVAGATGIQLFDAQSRDVMEMVPVAEAVRQDNFEEEIKISLEVESKESLGLVKKETADCVEKETVDSVKEESVDRVKKERATRMEKEPVGRVKKESAARVKKESVARVKKEPVSRVKKGSLVKDESVDLVDAESLDLMKKDLVDLMEEVEF